MKWERERYTPWKSKIAWLPMQFDDTWIWLERYEKRRSGSCSEYRLPGNERIYTDFNL